jgi:hypothetical protein
MILFSASLSHLGVLGDKLFLGFLRRMGSMRRGINENAYRQGRRGGRGSPSKAKDPSIFRHVQKPEMPIGCAALWGVTYSCKYGSSKVVTNSAISLLDPVPGSGSHRPEPLRKAAL